MAGEGHPVHVERSAKRVRAKVGRDFVADTERALLVWEHSAYPAYYLPRADVQAELVPTGRVEHGSAIGRGQLCDLRLGDRRQIDAGALICEEPTMGVLADHVRITWDAVDAWFEEDEEIFVHPRDPYTRIDILPSSRHVVVRYGELVLADSPRPLVLFETGLPPRMYLPATDVDPSLLEPSSTVTRCPYKGRASYYSLRSENVGIADIAWRYLYTTSESTRIAGLYCFHDEKVEVVVDGERREQGRHPAPV